MLRLGFPIFLAFLSLDYGCRDRSTLKASFQQGEARRCQALVNRLQMAGATLPPPDFGQLPRPGSGTVLLVFHVEGHSVHRYLARGSRINRLAPLSLRATEALIIKTRDELEHGQLETPMITLPGLLRRLHTHLLKGARRLLKGATRLVVGPDRMLSLVPFHALVTSKPSARLRFLAQDLEVSYCPCLLSNQVAPGNRVAPSRVTVVVPHYGGAGLEGAGREVEGIRIRYPEARVLEGEQATAARMVEALRAPGVVHFMGHGLADLAPGTVPELLFGERQAPLTLAALTRAPVRSRLVVLAACTAGYPARFRDGKRLWARTGPVEALWARGAHAVVAASWLVKDRLSAAQMRMFYDRLDRGPGAALTHSYRELIRRMHPPHPRFWAGYALYQSAL